jgi:hypothetical protein
MLLLRPHFWKEGWQPHFGSEGDDLSFRIKKLLHRNAQKVPRAAGGVKYPDARYLLGKTPQKVAEGVV